MSTWHISDVWLGKVHLCFLSDRQTEGIQYKLSIGNCEIKVFDQLSRLSFPKQIEVLLNGLSLTPVSN